MFQYDISRDVDCSQETAFDFMTNPRNDPDWWVGVLRTDILSDQDHGVGTRYRQHCKLMGRRFDVDFECTEYDRPRRIHLKTTAGPTPFSCDYQFDARGNGARLAMVGTVEGEHWTFRMAGPLFRWHLMRVAERAFDRLKRVLDAKTVPSVATPTADGRGSR